MDPLEAPIYIAVYRNTEDEVNFLQLNQLSAFLLESLQNNQTLNCRDVLVELAEQLQSPDTESIIEFGMEIIKDWYRKDIIEGVQSS